MTDVLKLFGERVRNIRKAQGLSQEELAERADLHNTYVGGVERGERNLSLKSVEKIACALKTATNIFFVKQRGFVVSEESEGKSYASGKKKTFLPIEQELLKYFNSLKNDELKNHIVSMLRIVSKTQKGPD